MTAKPKTKTITAQEHAEKIIRKHGGVQRKDGKWDMTKGVEAEKEKGQRK